MFDKLLNALHEESGFSHFSSIIGNLETLLEKFEVDYLKDTSARNAALDAICEFLQSQKETK